MTKRYIVVDYNSGKLLEPVLAAEYVSLGSAEEGFEKLKTGNEKRSVVLFDTQTAIVEKIAILGEPIYLGKAIAFARTFVSDESILGEASERALVDAAGVIGNIAGAIAGNALPGIGNVVMGHFIAPYYAFKGDAVALAKAATGMYGGFSGAIIGFVVGGPVGAVIGGAIGGIGMGEGAAALVKLGDQHPACKNCKGTGLVAYYMICPKCKGFGYKK